MTIPYETLFSEGGEALCSSYQDIAALSGLWGQVRVRLRSLCRRGSDCLEEYLAVVYVSGAASLRGRKKPSTR
jgi:hypothetical protein